MRGTREEIAVKKFCEHIVTAKEVKTEKTGNGEEAAVTKRQTPRKSHLNNEKEAVRQKQRNRRKRKKKKKRKNEEGTTDRKEAARQM